VGESEGARARTHTPTPIDLTRTSTPQRAVGEVDMTAVKRAANHSPILSHSKVLLAEWLPKFQAHYHVPGALVTTSLEIKRAHASRPPLLLNRQFCRDIAGGLLRVEGTSMPTKRKFLEAASRRDKTYEDTVLYSYAWKRILNTAQKNTELAQFVTTLANQNLGINLYEHVCKALCDADPAQSLAVLQTGQHSVNVSRLAHDNEQVQVRFEAIFETRPIDFIEDILSARMLAASVCIALSPVTAVTAAATAEGLQYEGTVTYEIRRPVLPIRDSKRNLERNLAAGSGPIHSGKTPKNSRARRLVEDWLSHQRGHPFESVQAHAEEEDIWEDEVKEAEEEGEGEGEGEGEVEGEVEGGGGEEEDTEASHSREKRERRDSLSTDAALAYMRPNGPLPLVLIHDSLNCV